MSDKYIYPPYLVKTIAKVFEISNIFLSRKLEADILKLFSNYDNFSRDEIYKQFRQILCGYNRIPELNNDFNTIRLDDRIKNIKDILEKISVHPKTILDIGAGTGEIIYSLGEFYHISSNNLYAIDQKLSETKNLTLLSYIDKQIPLPSHSVDVILLFSVIHHIPLSDRTILLSEIKRLLSPTGAIIIREHDYDNDRNFLIFIDLVHIFWYIVGNEKEDGLFLMTRSETQLLFDTNNLKSENYYPLSGPNPQKLYYEVYTHK